MQVNSNIGIASCLQMAEYLLGKMNGFIAMEPAPAFDCDGGRASGPLRWERGKPPSGDFYGKGGRPKARVDLGGSKNLVVTTETAAMGGGAVSKRVMVTGTIKF